MKKIIALLIALCLTFCMIPAALADSVEAEPIDQLRNVVKEYLNDESYTYEFDEATQSFTLSFSLNCALSVVDVAIYLYDDMVSVAVESPLPLGEENFEKAAIFTTLVNSKIYYAQFRVSREGGYIACRSCQLIETVVPEREEIDTLLVMPLIFMEYYGDGIAEVSAGGDPYAAFEKCQAAIDAM